jgi:hypothetical protein
MPEGTERSSSQLLNLDDLAPKRDYVTVDGTRYDVLNPAEATLMTQARLRRLMTEISDLEEKGEEKLTDEDDQQHDEKLRDLAKLIVPKLPMTKLNKLTKEHLGQLVSAFFVRRVGQSGTMRMVLEMLQQMTPASTGAGSSRGSNASTREATPTAGSM